MSPSPPAGFEPLDEDDSVALYQVLDEHEQANGAIVGVEIDDFLAFDRWNVLPKLPILWELPGEEPAPLADVLRRVQARLRRRVLASTS